MKNLIDIISEKLIINKHSKAKCSLDTSTATAKFNDPKELSKWKPNEFDKIIVDFISEYITITPFYLWEYKLGSSDMSDFNDIYSNHLKELKFYNLPIGHIKTKSIVNDSGTAAYANIFTRNDEEQYIMVNVIEANSRKMISILQN